MTADRQFQLVPVKEIKPHPKNPRKFSKTLDRGVNEMAQSVAEIGVLEPLLVRRKGKGYQLVAGERRFRSAKKAKLAEVPCMVYEDLSDADAMHIMALENLEREDLSPIEEAASIELMLDQPGWDLSAVADKLGRSLQWVAQRRRLVKLCPEWRKAFADPDSPVANWSGAHMRTIAILEHESQRELLEEYLDDNFYTPQVTAKELREHVDASLLKLSSAPWKLDDEKLVPKAGACRDCPMRSGANPGLFDDPEEKAAEHANADVCLEPKCWARKAEAFVVARAAELRQVHGDKLLLLSGGYGGGLREPPAELNVDRHSLFSEFDVDKKKKGATHVGLFVSGERAGHSFPCKVRSHVQRGSVRLDSSSGQQKGPKSLKEKEAGLQKRREKRATVLALELIAKVPKFDKRESVVRLAAGFGTHMHGYGFHDIHVNDLNWKKVRETKITDVYQTLWRRVLLRLGSEIYQLNSFDPPRAWKLAKELFSVVPSIDPKALLAQAVEEIPEPKSWAKEREKAKADG